MAKRTVASIGRYPSFLQDFTKKNSTIHNQCEPFLGNVKLAPKMTSHSSQKLGSDQFCSGPVRLNFRRYGLISRGTEIPPVRLKFPPVRLKSPRYGLTSLGTAEFPPVRLNLRLDFPGTCISRSSTAAHWAESLRVFAFLDGKSCFWDFFRNPAQMKDLGLGTMFFRNPRPILCGMRWFSASKDDVGPRSGPFDTNSQD